MTITVWKHDIGPSTYKDKEFREKYDCLSYMDGREKAKFCKMALRPLHRHSVCANVLHDFQLQKFEKSELKNHDVIDRLR